MDVLFRRENEDGSVSRVPGYFRTLPETIHVEQHLDTQNNKFAQSANRRVQSSRIRIQCGPDHVLFRMLFAFSSSPTVLIHSNTTISQKKHCLVNPRNTIICVCCVRCWRLCIHRRPVQIKYSTHTRLTALCPGLPG